MSGGFIRELLLGPDAVKPAQRSQIGRYFAEVIAQRGFPLHLASLWNALYFEWELEERGYVAAVLDPARVERRSLGATDHAVPVGGFVSVAAGDGEVWAEVVYKEGRHPAVEAATHPEAEFPPQASGARAEVSGLPRMAAIAEALVLDWKAFGPDWNEQKDLDRLRRRGQLDRFGHLTMTAAYDADEADLDDAAYFASYLVHHHREGLLGEFVKPGTPDEDLHSLVLVSLDTIGDIVAKTKGLIRAAGYVALADDYEGVVADASPMQRVGFDYFAGVLGSLTGLPSRARVGYKATGQALLGYLGRGGLDADEVALLSGPGYARLVTYTNLYLGQKIRAVTDGLIERQGSFYHLRRDDPWQWGGVWRRERVTGGKVPVIARIPPLVALGLGAGEGAASESAYRDEPLVGPTPPASIEIEGDTRRWTSVLSERNLDDGTLGVGAAARFISGLAASGSFRLKVSVEGLPAETLFNDLVRFDPREKRISDVEWGIEVFAGVRLHCSLERNGLAVRAELRPLVPPTVINGVTYAFDHAGAPGRRIRRALAPDEMRRASSLRELVARAFRARGEPLADGAFRADLRTIAVAVGGHGDGTVSGEIMSLVSSELHSMGLPRDDEGKFLWQPLISRATRLTEATTLGAFGATAAGRRAARFVRPTVVRMHLRRWDHQDPSAWEKRRGAYPIDLSKYGANGRLAPELPRGYTYVSAFQRSGGG